MPTEKPAQHQFQAEVGQLLDIVTHSLYTDREIFVRELVSNASDALEKMRLLQLTEKEIFDDKLPLEINITTDETAKTLTIADYGIGMTRDELVENLGTIAHSGSKAFVEAMKQGGKEGGERHRPVRRRVLLGVHGRERGEGLHPFLAERRRASGLDQRRRHRLQHRGGARPAPRMPARAAPEG